MGTTNQSITRKKIVLPVPIGGLINALNNLQSKIDEASGAATALEMRLRLVTQLVPEVQAKIKGSYLKADLYDLIPAIIEIFQPELTQEDCQKIESCRPPRNKLTHADMAAFMMLLNGEAPSRLLNIRTGKGHPIAKDNLLEGALSVERSGALEKFTQKAREAVAIVDSKILRALE